uniref:Orf65 n=1 Tax=Serratia marcescens TaxID=615 RepID=A0A7S6YMD4_SERMA|nr:Orf65 [Serratia marcescens]
MADAQRFTTSSEKLGSDVMSLSVTTTLNMKPQAQDGEAAH